MADSVDRRSGESALLAVERAVTSGPVFKGLDESARRRVAEQLEWLHLPSGEALIRRGDAADCLYIVISGRLRVFVERGQAQEEALAEIGRGQVVGEMAFLTGEKASATVRAIRDTDVVRFSRDVFDEITRANPLVMVLVARRLINRLRQMNRGASATTSLSTIALLPISPGLALGRLAGELHRSFQTLGTTARVDRARLRRELATPDGKEPDESDAISWLDELERAHAHVLYEADFGFTPWTSRCLRQADRVLLVASSGAQPLAVDPDGELRRTLERSRARYELVLVHPAGGGSPEATAAWTRAWDAGTHHHLREGAPADAERLVRSLTGRTVGLVLGGGGARGFAHIGVIRALREAGIPIDAVGGTSMGAVIAAQCALGLDPETMRSVNRDHWVRANPLKDKTLPVVALLSCRRLDRMVSAMFGDTRIEDLWTKYFCVSADLTRAEPKIHVDGLLRRAVRASMSLPGMAIPVYEDGGLLIDGGVMNNVPGDVMQQLHGGRVIAVDVTPEKDLAVSGPYPEAASGWRLLLERKSTNLPSILAIMMRTVMLSSAHHLRRVSGSFDLYIHPPMERFGMFDWHSLDPIVESGYRAAREALDSGAFALD